MKNLTGTFYLLNYDIQTRLLLLDGSESMTGNLKMGNHKIVNLVAPTNNTDATNKTYIDTNF